MTWRPEPFVNTEADIDVHTYFGLSYANYLVLHRTLLQSMPDEWQQRFVRCLQELEDALGHAEGEHIASYRVHPIDRRGRFVRETIPHYNRGRTRIEPRV